MCDMWDASQLERWIYITARGSSQVERRRLICHNFPFRYEYHCEFRMLTCINSDWLTNETLRDPQMRWAGKFLQSSGLQWLSYTHTRVQIHLCCSPYSTHPLSPTFFLLDSDFFSWLQPIAVGLITWWIPVVLYEGPNHDDIVVKCVYAYDS